MNGAGPPSIDVEQRPRIASPQTVRDEVRALAADGLESGHEVALRDDAVLDEPARQPREGALSSCCSH